MLALRAVLSAAFTSAFTGVSAFGVSAPTFAATAATLSLVFSTFAGCATALGVASAFSPAFVVLSAVVLFDTSSDA